MIQLNIVDNRAEIILDRPEHLNALSLETFSAIDLALDQIMSTDADAVVLRGAGNRAFCAGADIDELARSREDTMQWLLAGHSVLRRLETFSRPVVAVVTGLALGGGFELAMSCHMLVATTQARFGLPEPRLGLIPGLGGIQRLPAIVGRQRANHLLLTGSTLTAAEADRVGLLAIPPVEPDELDSVIEGICRTISKLAPTAVATILGSTVAAELLSFEESLLHDVNLAVGAIHSPAGQEGIAAFGAKRAPSFRRPGRAND